MTPAPLEIMLICQGAGTIIIHWIVHKIEQLTFSHPHRKKEKDENHPEAEGISSLLYRWVIPGIEKIQEKQYYHLR